jgi:NAD(P)H-hydrate epimerase
VPLPFLKNLKKTEPKVLKKARLIKNKSISRKNANIVIMKIFTTAQTALIDSYTIDNEPVSHLNLMERAAVRLKEWLEEKFSSRVNYTIFAGPGNNGGDALALARLLADQGYRCRVMLAANPENLTGSVRINYKKLREQGVVEIENMIASGVIPEIEKGSVVIEGLFGSGINRAVEGFALEVIKKINSSGERVVSIDMPGGLFGEDNTGNHCEGVVKADYTLTFQYPKLAMLFPEYGKFCGQIAVLDIGLHPGALASFESVWFYTCKEDISGIIRPRGKFSHKGTYGSALLIAGSTGKTGAAILSSKAAMRSGLGLLTVHLPRNCYKIVQMAVPEAMCSVDPEDSWFSFAPPIEHYSAVGAGPGMGLNPASGKALKALLQAKPSRLILDADALNLISANRDLLEILPGGTIITPHLKEFERLAGPSDGPLARMRLQLDMSVKYGIIVVLKGAHSCVTFPDGTFHFNSTGNPGMATAGSGDVLTGVILSLLAQGYSPEESAMAGVYIHGLAGDIAASGTGEISLMSGDIINYLPSAFIQIFSSILKR